MRRSSVLIGCWGPGALVVGVGMVSRGGRGTRRAPRGGSGGGAQPQPAPEGEQQWRRESRQGRQDVSGDRLLGLLHAVHLRPDVLEAPDGIDEPYRQPGKYGG